jgi:hypothetical protein
MNLNNRITRLEQTISKRRCECPNNADLSWPGHQPHRHCPQCAGERILYPLARHPRGAESLLRAALPIISKTYAGDDHADLSRLSDDELQQLKEALQAAERAAQSP